MKILVFSDSHGLSASMKNAIDMHKTASSVDCIFYLGDGVNDLIGLSPQIPICYADGNYEEYMTSYLSRKNLKTETVIDLMGFKFLLPHGHRYGVKSDLTPLILKAKKLNVDVVLFGHTHEQYYEYLPTDNDEKPMYIFNPGSISRPRDSKFSYGIIEIQGKNILFNHATVKF